jgi:hypothetical protein
LGEIVLAYNINHKGGYKMETYVIMHEELEKENHIFLGSITTHIISLKEKAIKNLEQGYNQIVVTMGESFHRPTINMWMIKGKNNIDKIDAIYKYIVLETLKTFGLSRKSERSERIFAYFMNRQ